MTESDNDLLFEEGVIKNTEEDIKSDKKIDNNDSKGLKEYKQTEELNIKKFAKLVILFGCASTLQCFLGMLVDVWIIGQINSEYMHAIGTPLLAIGSLYSLLGFIRISVVGFSSKAKYLNDKKEQWISFLSPAVASVLLGIAFIILHQPMIRASIFFNKLPADIIGMAREYYDFIMWAAPVHLLNFTIAGWLMGRYSMVRVLLIQVVGNALNIGLGIYFTWELNMLAAGVGWATIISQAVMCIIGLIFVFISLPKKNVGLCLADFKAISKTLISFNFDLLLRTIFLAAQLQIHNLILISLNESFISINNILMNIVLIATGIFEGVANAASLYAGRAMVEKNHSLLSFTMKMTNIFTIAIGVLLSILFIILRVPYAEIISNNIASQEGVIRYSLWLIPYFLFGGFATTYLGIFLGTVYTKPIATSAFMALATFVFIYYVTSGVVIQNGYSGFVALWIAYMGFNIIRSLGLYLYRGSLLIRAD